jgi:hypothetical protein
VAHEEASQTIVAADQTYGWAQFLVRLARKGAPKALSVAEDPVTWNRIFSVIARFDPKLVKMSDDGKNDAGAAVDGANHELFTRTSESAGL